jgi:hypothetical protein
VFYNETERAALIAGIGAEKATKVEALVDAELARLGATRQTATKDLVGALAQLPTALTRRYATEIAAKHPARKSLPSAITPFVGHLRQHLGFDEPAQPAVKAVDKAPSPRMAKMLAAIASVNRRLGLSGVAVKEEAPSAAPESAASPFAAQVKDVVSGKGLGPGLVNALTARILKPRR